MPPSPIRKLVPYAEAAAKQGVEIFYLNIGQPDIKTPSLFIDAIKADTQEVLAYSHSAGNESYRIKLAKYYRFRGIELDHTDLIITTGGSEAIIFAMMCCFNPGDEIIIPEPFYANYNGFANMSGVKVVPLASDIQTGFALPSISEFEKLITPKTKGILICNPNNPTGYLYSTDELNKLKDLVIKHDLFLFADEVYRDFCYDGNIHTSILTLDGLTENAVVIDSVSKQYSACGARIGTLISRNKSLMASAIKFAQARLSPPTYEQIGAEAALDTPLSYFTDVVKEYVSRRDVMVAGLNKIPGVFCPMPGGAFYCVVKLPIDNCDKFCTWMLEEFRHNNQTVMMAPASGFYSTPGLGNDEVRIAYVLKKENLEKAIECIAKALEVYPGRTNK